MAFLAGNFFKNADRTDGLVFLPVFCTCGRPLIASRLMARCPLGIVSVLLSNLTHYLDAFNSRRASNNSRTGLRNRFCQRKMLAVLRR